MFERTQIGLHRSEALGEAGAGVITAYASAIVFSGVFLVPAILVGEGAIVLLVAFILVSLAVGLVPIGALFGYVTWRLIRAGARPGIVFAWAVLAGVLAPNCVLLTLLFLGGDGDRASLDLAWLKFGAIYAVPFTCVHTWLALRRARDRAAL